MNWLVQLVIIMQFAVPCSLLITIMLWALSESRYAWLARKYNCSLVIFLMIGFVALFIHTVCLPPILWNRFGLVFNGLLFATIWADRRGLSRWLHDKYWATVSTDPNMKGIRS